MGSKTRFPYERSVAANADLRKAYQQAMDAGSLKSPLEDGADFQKLYNSYHGASVPISGWPHLATELRLVELTLHSNNSPDRPGRAAIAKECRTLAAKTDQLERSVNRLADSPDFLFSLIARGLADGNWGRRRTLIELREDLTRTAAHLERNSQPPKWRMAKNRELRVALAVRLAALFEKQFGQLARPLGGSAAIDLKDANDWTRFYQMAAKAFWDEAATPDRQAILWEATLPPAW